MCTQPINHLFLEGEHHHRRAVIAFQYFCDDHRAHIIGKVAAEPVGTPLLGQQGGKRLERIAGDEPKGWFIGKRLLAKYAAKSMIDLDRKSVV